LEKFVQIDEQGYGLFGEIRIADQEVGKQLLESVYLGETGIVHSKVAGENVTVEAFDQPFVAQQVNFDGKEWTIQTPYDTHFSFSMADLSLDEWDRFHGLTSKGIPFVFSRPAQAHFFNLLQDYTDDSITHGHRTYEVGPYLVDNREIEDADWWTEVYTTEGKPRWDLAEPAPALKEMLPRLKLPKSRILVLGAGEGHDAAFFAKDGHNVTAVDISPEAIKRAKEHYGKFNNIEWVEDDIFELGSEYHESFDLVFEHTCYCAVNPSRRPELVKIWNRSLVEKGSLLGVFNVIEKRRGPPFGASEWEVRERLKKNYQFLFWGRWRQSIPRRQGKELFVYAQKRS
jgi:SAM-dependent methyltransferase